jgi:glycosyltransferase involved in cell wall biosynthesis
MPPQLPDLLLWYWGRRGGGAQYTCALAEGLVENRQFRVSASVSHKMESLARLRQAVPDIQIVALDGSLKSAPLLIPGPTSFRSSLRRRKVDIVLHTMVNPLTPFAWPRHSGIPIATVIHDAVPHLGDTVGSFDRASRFAQKYSDLLIAPSQSVADVLRARNPRSSIETIVLPPHLSLPDLWDPKGDVLFLGRIARYKGLDLLAEVWSGLSEDQDFADMNVHLRVVGEPVSAEPSIDRLRNAGATVETRWVPDEELVDVMRGVRLLVLPYIEASQSGVITLAHAAGIPLLVTDVGGLAAQAGLSARVTEPHSNSFGEGLRVLLGSPHELNRLRAEAMYIREQSEVAKLEVADQLGAGLHRLGKKNSAD